MDKKVLNTKRRDGLTIEVYADTHDLDRGSIMRARGYELDSTTGKWR